MFTHILFPTDTSECGNAGFDTAVEMARRFSARITMLNIHEEFMDKQEMENLRVSVEHYQEMMENKAKASRAAMETLAAKADDVRVDVLIREGNPRNTITEIAAEVGADLIVMSSNGRSNLKQALIGSVAEHVVRISTLPVLVVKIPR